MSKGKFSTTPQERYLEDYVEGAVHEFGPITITEDEIVQFGKKKINMQPYKTHRFAGFAVLKAPDVPSVLIEMGYLSNKTDKKMLLSGPFRKKVGRAILATLDVFFKHVVC